VDDGRNNVSNDHGKRYTCAQKESAVALPVFIVRLLCLTCTKRSSLMFPDQDIVASVDES
jgi:hypothetical protein